MSPVHDKKIKYLNHRCYKLSNKYVLSTDTVRYTAADPGNIKMILLLRSICSLVSMSPFTLSLFLSYPHGKLWVLYSILLHRFQDVLFSPITVTSFPFPFYLLCILPCLMNVKRSTVSWLLSPGSHIPTGKKSKTLFTWVLLEEEILAKVKARKRAWFEFHN